MRHRIIEGDRQIVVFPALSTNQAKLLPLNDDFMKIDDPLDWPRNGLWLSEGSKKLRLLTSECKLDVVTNRDSSLVGIRFRSLEGGDSKRVSFLGTILTRPLVNDRVIVIRIELPELKDDFLGLEEILTQNLAEEIESVSKSMRLLPDETASRIRNQPRPSA